VPQSEEDVTAAREDVEVVVQSSVPVAGGHEGGVGVTEQVLPQSLLAVEV